MQLPPGVALVPMVDSNEDSGDLLISVRRLSAMARARVSRDAYRTQETLSSSDLLRTWRQCVEGAQRALNDDGPLTL